jgi:hypothetical protein
MTSYSMTESSAARKAITAMFDGKPPILVEVRFPNMGTSPDWYLCDDEQELGPILEPLAAGVEVYLRSVWDLTATPQTICLRK